jgi:serine/threonine protein phosphatase 1
MLHNFFRRRLSKAAPAAMETGMRVYAVGDIHGRLDLLDRMLDLIAADDARRASATTRVIFLGDLIDRGPDSSGVVERLRVLAGDHTDMDFLLGNHEEVFLLALGGDTEALRAFCRIGGRETILSYGITDSEYERMTYEELGARLQEVVPLAHRTFLEGFGDIGVYGDYAFVHAGVNPAIRLEQQRPSDLRWIRAPFLDHDRPLEKMVVHGHTITPEVMFRPHRIGIDTGAYESGKLTALGLEGVQRWLLQT